MAAPTASTCTRPRRAAGESAQRLALPSAWRDAPCYTERERAALAWTDALTRLSENHTREAAYAELEAQFGVDEQLNLTLIINVMSLGRARSCQIGCQNARGVN